MSTTPTVGYWDIKGLGEQIRQLLRYSGVQFNDKRYDTKQREVWREEKPTLGLDFPNLPYYIDSDVKLTQSVAIMRYLGKKHGLIATDPITGAVQDMVEQQLIDIKNGFMKLVHSPDWEQKKADYVKDTLTPQLDSFAKFLAKSGKWVTKDLSYVDFIAYNLLTSANDKFADTIANYPAITDFLTRFGALKGINV